MSKVYDHSKWDSSAIKYYNSIPRIQKQLRRINSNYLCNHPEIRAIIRVILHQTLNANPSNVREFVGNFFNCNKTPLLVPLINAQFKYVKEQLQRGRWNHYDADMLFTETGSTHSLLSTASTDINVHPVMTYALIFKQPDECGLDQPPAFQNKKPICL